MKAELLESLIKDRAAAVTRCYENAVKAQYLQERARWRLEAKRNAHEMGELIKMRSPETVAQMESERGWREYARHGPVLACNWHKPCAKGRSDVSGGSGQ